MIPPDLSRRLGEAKRFFDVSPEEAKAWFDRNVDVQRMMDLSSHDRRLVYDAEARARQHGVKLPA